MSPRAFLRLSATCRRSVSDCPRDWLCSVTTWVSVVLLVARRSRAALRATSTWLSLSPASASWRKESVRPLTPIAASCTSVSTAAGGMALTRRLADRSSSENSRGTVVCAIGMSVLAV